jgi:hypothetical protein
MSQTSCRHVSDFEILKKSSLCNAEKMRTIQLMVAGFNINNKKIGRGAMERAELLQIILRNEEGVEGISDPPCQP